MALGPPFLVASVLNKNIFRPALCVTLTFLCLRKRSYLVVRAKSIFVAVHSQPLVQPWRAGSLSLGEAFGGQNSQDSFPSLPSAYLPVLVPPVNIHAPVVLAAFSNPFRSTCKRKASVERTFRGDWWCRVLQECYFRLVCGILLLLTFFNFGCSSKLALPPCTVMSSLGSSRFHSRVNSCTSNNRCTTVVASARTRTHYNASSPLSGGDGFEGEWKLIAMNTITIY